MICIIAIAADGQKLPNIQATNIRAPSNLKIDGKCNEWEGLIQAFNKNTNVYYTIANDDKNLYLIAEVSDPRTIEKILTSGFSFIINKGDKNKGEITITYPVIGNSYIHAILANAGDKANWAGLSAGVLPSNVLSKQTLARTDSSVEMANIALSNRAKTITVLGIKGLQDSSISIYNEQNIKAATLFDKKGLLTYEVAVPLQLLDISITDAKKFKYQLRLNSCADYTEATFVVKDPITGAREQRDANTDIDVVTKLDGEYTLAKKP